MDESKTARKSPDEPVRFGRSSPRRGWQRVVPVFAGCALAISLAGACGAGSDADQVRDTVQALDKAIAEGDGDEACSHLSGEAQRKSAGEGMLVGAGSCAETFEKAAGMLGSEEKEAAGNVQVGKITLRGDRAEVPDSSVIGGDGKPLPDSNSDPIVVQKIDGTWMVVDTG